MSIIWHNGIFKGDTPVLETSDRIRLGDGVFDTMLIYEGKPVFAAAHFQRLLFHASVLGITLDLEQASFENAAQELLLRNGAATGKHVIRTLVTRGASENALKIPDKPYPQMIMRLSPFTAASKAPRAVIAQNVRRNEGSPLSRIKSVNYGDQILALQEAMTRDADEAILLNNAGHVTCASAGNIFAVINGALVTPPEEDGVLAGIIRKLVMDRHGATERRLIADDLLNSEGVYITSSLRGAVALHSLNGQELAKPTIKIDPALHLG